MFHAAHFLYHRSNIVSGHIPIIHHIEHQFAVFFRINNMVTVIIDKRRLMILNPDEGS